MNLLTEIITNAHMAGQHHAGCAHPSWGDALGHTHTVLPETLNRAARQHIKVAEQTPTNTRIAQALPEIAAELERYANDMNDHPIFIPQVTLYRWARQLRNA